PGRLEDLEPAVIEKVRVVPEQIVELGDRRMTIGKNLGIELSQGLFHLHRIQLHDLLHLVRFAGALSCLSGCVSPPVCSRVHQTSPKKSKGEANPIRSRACDRGWGAAKALLVAGHMPRMNPRGKRSRPSR